ncbi:hypothetical protein [Leptospira gomenensis]|uniref:hypothetical protein n=1 Tax=Leptospira gomenensis TaxID=2484974 RepID=UPI0010917761|nr:hypothetical protein [Leptospira gomenensis]
MNWFLERIYDDIRRIRFMLPNFRIFCITLALLLTTCSGSSKKFIRLKTENPSKAVLYLLRPSRIPMALWKERIRVLRYRTSFLDEEPVSKQEFRLSDGEYICLESEEGYHRLVSSDSEKVLYLEKNRIRYLDYMIFNESFFSPAERYFKELEAEDALRLLLDGARLDRHPLSQD